MAAFKGRRRPAELGRATLWAAAGLCAISLGWAAAPVIWRLTGDSGQIIPPPAAVPDEPAARTDLTPLLAFAPFGQDTTSAPLPQAAGETDLGLTLLGVTLGSRPSASRAIISGGDTPVASYPIGARVTANADLAEVHPDHIVLRIDGEPERLSFARRPPVATPTAGNNPRTPLPPAAQPQPVPPTDDPTSPLDEMIAVYREAIEADARGFLDDLGLIPSEGGYRIGENPAPDLSQAGFKPGDMITLVNGRRVGDIDADRQHFDAVVASGQIRVELQRDGQPIAMSFLLR